jgi:hypothetical protein
LETIQEPSGAVGTEQALTVGEAIEENDPYSIFPKPEDNISVNSCSFVCH